MNPRSILAACITVLALNPLAFASDWHCSYSWAQGNAQHQLSIHVDQASASVDFDLLENRFEVLSDSDSELLLVRTFTRVQNGEAYPVGLSAIVLDKRNGKLAFSNTFASTEQNNHAIGHCAKQPES